uniref:Prefoldin subunit 3 n=1 Tax=Bos taurus TaxID=9913 RepID=A0AAA9TXX2_BOVIN
MAASKDGCGVGEVAAGNGRRLHLGIPEAVFVEDVDSFMKQPGNETADIVLKKLDEQYQKYKFMELNLAQKKRRLKGQIPEIKQTLEILKYMQKKKESTSSLETRFLLADNLYCKASVPPTDKVCLWLGANVMLEYDIDEAQALLEKNLLTATKNLDSLEEDLDFLRDQFTTTEVSGHTTNCGKLMGPNILLGEIQITSDHRENCSPVGLTNGEGNGTPLQYSCLENPMNGGAW